jgi:hypothetical protein
MEVGASIARCPSSFNELALYEVRAITLPVPPLPRVLYPALPARPTPSAGGFKVRTPLNIVNVDMCAKTVQVFRYPSIDVREGTMVGGGQREGSSVINGILSIF